MKRLSGDQNGADAPSVWARGCESAWSSERTQSTRLLSVLFARKTTRLPSGDTVTFDGLSAFAGVFSASQTGRALVALARKWKNASTASPANSNRQAANHAKRSRAAGPLVRTS